MSKGFKKNEPLVWATKVTTSEMFKGMKIVHLLFKTVSGKPKREIEIAYPIDSARTFAQTIMSKIEELERGGPEEADEDQGPGNGPEALRGPGSGGV